MSLTVGDEYPQAEVIGIDLSPIQPSWVPPNVRFLVDDAEAPWVYSQPFDYIHARHMNATVRQWPKFFGQCFQ